MTPETTQVPGAGVSLARERWQSEVRQRRFVRWGLVTAVVLHGLLLFGRLPGFGPGPQRIEAAAPQTEEMKVQFLKPPPPQQVERPPDPVKKRVPRPDPTPREPEPEVIEPAPLPAPAPPAPPVPAPRGPVRVSPGQGPGLIKRVEPRYPPLAQSARMEGTVVLDAVIGRDGSVTDVKVLSSTNAMFEHEAVQAIRQWRYSSGAQDVILTVTVTFRINR